MKLSEAIRLGAMMKPQALGSLYKDGATCAIGAALDAVGELESALKTLLPYERAAALWPVLRVGIRDTKAVGSVEGNIITMNDRNEQSREAIADWVETIEQQQAAVTPEPVMVNT